MSKHCRSPNDPIQDFIDLQEHRYDPGYWTTEWNAKGRLDPFRESMRKAHLSSFYRALALFGLIAPFPLSLLGSLRSELPYAWLWCALVLTALFLGLWYFIHRSMIRNNIDGIDAEIEPPHRKKR